MTPKAITAVLAELNKNAIDNQWTATSERVWTTSFSKAKSEPQFYESGRLKFKAQDIARINVDGDGMVTGGYIEPTATYGEGKIAAKALGL